MKKYRIMKIEEPDFGCEGRPEKEKVKDRVILQEENGGVYVVSAEDDDLYEKNLNEGDFVFIDCEGNLQKQEE